MRANCCLIEGDDSSEDWAGIDWVMMMEGVSPAQTVTDIDTSLLTQRTQNISNAAHKNI